MIKPLHALLVRLKEFHIKVGEEDRKRHVHLHVCKAIITAQDTLAKLLIAMCGGRSAKDCPAGNSLDANALSGALRERDIPPLKLLALFTKPAFRLERSRFRKQVCVVVNYADAYRNDCLYV